MAMDTADTADMADTAVQSAGCVGHSEVVVIATTASDKRRALGVGVVPFRLLLFVHLHLRSK